MVTKIFLGGVVLGMLLMATAFSVREEFQSLDRRIHRVEKLFDLLLQAPTEPSPEQQHGLSYGRPQQEAL